MPTEKQVKSEFLKKELDYITAIEKLQEIGHTSRGAEEIVTSWENESEYSTGNKRYPREEDDENNEEGA